MFLIVLFLLACAPTSPENGFNTATSRLLPEPDLLDRLHYQKQLWDSGLYFNSFCYYQNKGESVLTKQLNEDSLIFKYELLQDSSGTIYKIIEIENIPDLLSPYTLTHYFDNEGKTFAVEFSESNEGGLFEEIVYFNNEFQLLEINQIIFQAWDGETKKSKLKLDTPLNFLTAPNLNSFLTKRKISLPSRH